MFKAKTPCPTVQTFLCSEDLETYFVNKNICSSKAIDAGINSYTKREQNITKQEKETKTKHSPHHRLKLSQLTFQDSNRNTT